MDFTKEQLEIINSENPKVLLELKGVEVMAIYSLGQMHNKIVRRVSVFDTTMVGLLTIESINGKTDLDFSNANDWKNIKVDDIYFSITSLNEFGSYDKVTTNNIFDVQSIALLGL